MDNFILSVFLLSMFVLSGINKTYSFSATCESLQKKIQFDMPTLFYNIIILIVILIEIVAPLIILYYFATNKYKKHAYNASISLIVFTILATIIYHPPNFSNYNKSIPFWANISLLGGLLFLSKLLLKK